jgi:hypothetical protein
VSKTAAVVLAFLSLMLFSTSSKAQLLPSGNVYVGVGYGDSVDVINRLYVPRMGGQRRRICAFPRYPYLGIVLDGSGFYRQGVSSTMWFSGRECP